MSSCELVSRHLTQVGFCDMTFQPNLDSLLTLDINGKLSSFNYLAQKELIIDENLTDQVQRFHWGQVLEHPDNVFLSRILTRKKVSIFDVRQQNIQNLYTAPTIECFSGFVSRKNPFQFYVNTNLKTVLLDERYMKMSMTEWFHPGMHHDKKVPQGLKLYYDQEHDMDYVFTYWYVSIAILQLKLSARWLKNFVLTDRFRCLTRFHLLVNF